MRILYFIFYLADHRKFTVGAIIALGRCFYHESSDYGIVLLFLLFAILFGELAVGEFNEYCKELEKLEADK